MHVNERQPAAFHHNRPHNSQMTAHRELMKNCPQLENAKLRAFIDYLQGHKLYLSTDYHPTTQI